MRGSWSGAAWRPGRRSSSSPLQVPGATADKTVPTPRLEDPLLRIDETSGTLVAPQAGGLVTENSPERDELLALVGASWAAFAQELGMPNLRLVAREVAPGADLLAFDEQTGRAVVLYVTGETVEWQIARALGAAAEVAGWDAAKLASVSDVLEAAVPGDSPQLVVVAGGVDPRAPPPRRRPL